VRTISRTIWWAREADAILQRPETFVEAAVAYVRQSGD
jgi:hypothetical protein